MARSCVNPDEIEVLGIGSRTHLYAQSILIVFISFIVRKRGKAHTTVTNLWRLQLYTFAAFAIACIYQRCTGKLSVFDEIAVYHTGALLLWSAAVGMMIQKGDSPLTPQHYVPVKIGTGRKRGIRHIPLATLTPWFIFVGCLTYMALAWVIFSKDSSCDNGTVRWELLPGRLPVIINGTDKGSLRVLLYLFIPMAGFILVPLVLRTAPCCKRFFSSFCAYVLPVAYLLFWVKEIYCIERSIMMMITDLPVSRRSEQSEWDFGQILSLVLVTPYVDRVFNEFLELYRAKDYLKNERSTEEIPNV